MSKLLFLFLTDNLWSVYGDKFAIVEKQDQPSVPVLEETDAKIKFYVYSDIMTYFTMLVGIYFPSVTGIVPLPPFLCLTTEVILCVLIRIAYWI